MCQPLREAVSWSLHILLKANWKPVSLFVRLWVEIILSAILQLVRIVSLFVRLCVEIWTLPGVFHGVSVSLFVRLWVEMSSERLTSSFLLSASSWGCELKYHCHYDILISSSVSLFVRLWVEISVSVSPVKTDFVSLFVRLWVEITITKVPQQEMRSASSWGCELKFLSSKQNS